MNSPQVLIVGAGPTGLVLAIWLARFGVSIRIIDKTEAPGTTSRAMGVHARTLEFYRQLGIADAVVECGIKIAGVNLWGRGSKAARIPLSDIGTGLSPYPFLLDFPQDQHERFLINHLHTLGITVERPTELIGYEASLAGVRATLRHARGTEENCEFPYLIGCDGARSVVRNGLHVGFAGSTYEGVFYVADVEASGPPIDGELHVDLDDGDFVGIFPYRGSGTVRLIGATRRKPCEDHADLTFDDIRGRAIEQMRITVHQVNWFSTYHVHHRVAEYFRVGRVMLAGDAAHIHSPVGAQGMNTGIGDATNLAWKLAAVLNGSATEALLETYETERIAFAKRLVRSTDRAFTLVTNSGWLADFVRLRIVPRVIPVLLRFGFVRRFIFRTVSQIGIQYRSSNLSEGVAGGIHGGERLPWMETVPGQDNFAPLASLDWQVHVYGEASEMLVAACEELRLSLHRVPWRADMQRSGFKRDGIYLIRPDGYVALAAGTNAAMRLRSYFAKRVGLLNSDRAGVARNMK